MTPGLQVRESVANADDHKPRLRGTQSGTVATFTAVDLADVRGLDHALAKLFLLDFAKVDVVERVGHRYRLTPVGAAIARGLALIDDSEEVDV